MSATSGPFVLQAVGIEKRFGVTTVLDGASLRVRPGEIHALLGGNGAGTSTLIKIVSGVLPADGGRVRVDDSDAPDPGAIAVVFQELRACGRGAVIGSPGRIRQARSPHPVILSPRSGWARRVA